MKTLGMLVLAAVGTVGALKFSDAPIAQAGAETLPIVSRPAASAANAGGRTTALVPQNAEDNAPHEFKVSLKQILPGGSALANGGFFQRAAAPKSYSNPLEKPRYSSRGWTPAGDIFISGLPDGPVDGSEWHGWLVRTGAKSFTTVLGAPRTVAAYQVVAAPTPDAPKPGAWMWKR